ncbi:bacteriocin production protein [Chitiniphilus shinanonensis]|uniref:Bacteriocin production protein n=1 Tax=Chitiniphilus shinanonensis TaxID=553088 RepID=A0ABQ6BQ00_9NEIS|nr:CvpA family protein [Chitiniphilus shinanonensis]GLS03362.1 bacteriocin production protein [Chitiniphilus shinanonensis]
MTVFDYVVLAILGLSVLLSVMRGLVQELMALAAWVAAAWVALSYADEAAAWVPDGLPSAELRYLAGFAGLFFAVWLLATLLRITLNQFLKATGLKPLDRALGGAFGLVRGLLFVMLIVIGAGLTPVPKSRAWQDAMFSPLFEASARLVLPWLPKPLAERVRYE